jgi:GNAT superfamily N-acetyltransferase
MTSTEWVTLRSRLIREYAAEHVEAGTWPADEAERRASEQTDELLPQGVDTSGMLMFMAVNSAGDHLGHLWLALERRPGSGGGAWINDIEIVPEWRGHGFGRELLLLAEETALEHGIYSIGLNVFGTNMVARGLYESAGYEVATMQMRKSLGPDSGSGAGPVT